LYFEATERESGRILIYFFPGRLVHPTFVSKQKPPAGKLISVVIDFSRLPIGKGPNCPRFFCEDRVLLKF
jgi:hypothetical protein